MLSCSSAALEPDPPRCYRPLVVRFLLAWVATCIAARSLSGVLGLGLPRAAQLERIFADVRTADIVFNSSTHPVLLGGCEQLGARTAHVGHGIAMRRRRGRYGTLRNTYLLSFTQAHISGAAQATTVADSMALRSGLDSDRPGASVVLTSRVCSEVRRTLEAIRRNQVAS